MKARRVQQRDPTRAIRTEKLGMAMTTTPVAPTRQHLSTLPGKYVEGLTDKAAASDDVEEDERFLCEDELSYKNLDSSNCTTGNIITVKESNRS